MAKTSVHSTAFRAVSRGHTTTSELAKPCTFWECKRAKKQQSPQEPTGNSVSREGHVVWYSNQNASLHSFTQPGTVPRRHFLAVSEKCKISAITKLLTAVFPTAQDSPNTAVVAW